MTRAHKPLVETRKGMPPQPSRDRDRPTTPPRINPTAFTHEANTLRPRRDPSVAAFFGAAHGSP